MDTPEEIDARLKRMAAAVKADEEKMMAARQRKRAARMERLRAAMRKDVAELRVIIRGKSLPAAPVQPRGSGMVGWLRRLFTGEPDCRHEYEEKERIFRFGTDAFLPQLIDKPVGWYCLLRCKTCGWVCKRRL